MRYAIVIEKGRKNFSAYVPTFQVVAVGDTVRETEREIQEAIEVSLEGLPRTAFRSRPSSR